MGITVTRRVPRSDVFLRDAQLTDKTSFSGTSAEQWGTEDSLIRAARKAELAMGL